MKEPTISVIRLGYVGLPLALAFADAFVHVVLDVKGMPKPFEVLRNLSYRCL